MSAALEDPHAMKGQVQKQAQRMEAGFGEEKESTQKAAT